MQTVSEQQTLLLMDLQQSFLTAALRKNGSFMDEHLHEEFIFTSPRAVVLFKEGFTRDFVLNPDIKLEVFNLSEAKVVIACKAAVVNCLVHVRPVGKADFWERVTFSLVMEGNKWLILALHATFTP